MRITKLFKQWSGIDLNDSIMLDFAMFLRLTLYLFVRQWRDWDEAVLGVESLVEPVKVFVSPRHLDVVELKTRDLQVKLSTSWRRTYTWGQLICNVTLKTFELGFLLGGCYHTGVGRGGALPAVPPVTFLLQLEIRN